MDHAEGHLAAARDWYLEGVDAIPAEGWTKPSLCAGWTAAHVVAHLATGDQLVRGLILDALGGERQGQDLPVDFADRQRRMQLMTAWEPSRLAEASRRESEQLVAALEDAVQRAPTTVITMPFGEAPLTTVRARRINEYIIHGYDLSPAIGRRRPIPTRHLEGTLGEVVMTMARLHQRSPHKGRSASFHFHRTDGAGEWILRADGGEAVVEATHGKADVAMRGPAEGLYLVMLGRGAPHEHGIEVHGDAQLAGAFKEWFPGP